MKNKQAAFTWKDFANAAYTKTDVPLAFFLAMQVMNRNPHDIELAEFLRTSITALKDARHLLSHIAEGGTL